MKYPKNNKVWISVIVSIALILPISEKKLYDLNIISSVYVKEWIFQESVFSKRAAYQKVEMLEYKSKVKNQIQNILAGKKQKTVYESWMKELRDSAYIEISLFKKPEKALSSTLFNNKNARDEVSDLKTSKNIQKNKKGISVNRAEKKKMQDLWEKMYKSVEKSKNRN